MGWRCSVPCKSTRQENHESYPLSYVLWIGKEPLLVDFRCYLQKGDPSQHGATATRPFGMSQSLFVRWSECFSLRQLLKSGTKELLFSGSSGSKTNASNAVGPLNLCAAS